MKKKLKKDGDKDYEIAYDFAIKAYKQFKEMIKAIIMFGSIAKGEGVKKSDIDIIILIDDCTINWDQELIAWYREELKKLIAKQKYPKDLHVNTVTLSVFWEELKAGEPVIINVLRYGRTLIDFGGFFDPLKILLAKGRIKPTSEAIFTTLRRAPDHIARAKYNILTSVEGFYWAMVDSAHAALMSVNEIPPSPEHVSDMLNVVFVKPRKLEKKYVDWFNELHKLAKEITHGNIVNVQGSVLETQQRRTEEFVRRMVKLAGDYLREKKIVKIEKK
jgi:predicted nucleotidyltransferase/uncharacterized protein (UPF0332 family)